jgi:TPR repeat protein
MKFSMGLAPAQTALGIMYVNGYGVPQNYTEALKWYRLAAAQGLAPAQTALGIMYVNGYGVPQDNAEALKWYHLAAAQGHARAQLNLGLMYVNGYGVPQDYVQAYKWFNLAAANFTEKQDRDAAVKGCDYVAARMTPAQIVEAKKLAREWKNQ